MPAWDSLTPEEKRFAARTMEEYYAGFLEHTDVQVGRLIEAINASGEAGNTLVFYVFGDNGGSAEGGLRGAVNYFADTHGKPETSEYRTRRIGLLGTEHSYTHYAAGWAWAMDTPYRWTKAVPAYLGATRNALVVSWPGHVSGPGSLRSQFGHVNDIAPTVLDAAGIALPPSVNGIARSRSTAQACWGRSPARKRRNITARNTSRCSAIDLPRWLGWPPPSMNGFRGRCARRPTSRSARTGGNCST